jgi:arabinofuranosyltransferase
VRWAQRVVFVVPVVAVLVAAWQLRWMSDDGFIHLRVVEQLVHGNGAVFNAGERVEASTSPLWVAVLALAYPLTPLALPWKAVVLGIVLTAAGVGLAERAGAVLARSAARPTARPTNGLVVPVGAITIAALPPFWEFASSGLETGLAFAWLGACCWWCARRVTGPVRRRAELAGAVLASLGPLIRPDLAVFTVAFGAVLVAAAAGPGWLTRRRLAVAAALVALPGAYQLFRMGYYAMVVPNTAVAKEAGHTDWDQGRQYVADLVSPYWLWVPFLLLGAVLAVQVGRAARARDLLPVAARMAPVAAALVHALYLTRLGGDFMHARLLLPAVFAIAAPVVVTLRPADLRLRAGGRPAAAAATTAAAKFALVAAVGAWALVCAVGLRRDVHHRAPWGGVQPVSADGTIAEERDFYRGIRHLAVPVRLDLSLAEQLRGDVRTWPQDGLGYFGETNEPVLERLPLADHLDGHVQARAVQAAMAVGAASVAWGDDVYVVDDLSLAHPVGSHLDEVVGPRPGHQKPVPLVWRVAGLTDGTRPVRVADDGRIVLTRRDLAAAEHARRCGRLGAYLDGIHAPLTPSRFVRNVAASLPNTTFRVPVDPHAAEARFCGS